MRDDEIVGRVGAACCSRATTSRSTGAAVALLSAMRGRGVSVAGRPVGVLRDVLARRRRRRHGCSRSTTGDGRARARPRAARRPVAIDDAPARPPERRPTLVRSAAVISRARAAITGETGFADSRAGLALRRPHNWMQLAKFCAVGASGYVVNLAVYALLLEVVGLHYLPPRSARSSSR